MHIITVRTQKNVSGKSRIICCRCNLHLQGKCQVIFQVWVGQITDISICPCPAEPVEEHDLRRRLTVYLCHQVRPFRHAIPVKIDHNFDSRILFQYFLHIRLCKLIRLTPIQFSIHQIIYPFVMICGYSILLIQKFRQIRPHSHN